MKLKRNQKIWLPTPDNINEDHIYNFIILNENEKPPKDYKEYLSYLENHLNRLKKEASKEELNKCQKHYEHCYDFESNVQDENFVVNLLNNPPSDTLIFMLEYISEHIDGDISLDKYLIKDVKDFTFLQWIQGMNEDIICPYCEELNGNCDHFVGSNSGYYSINWDMNGFGFIKELTEYQEDYYNKSIITIDDIINKAKGLKIKQYLEKVPLDENCVDEDLFWELGGIIIDYDFDGYKPGDGDLLKYAFIENEDRKWIDKEMEIFEKRVTKLLKLKGIEY
tara:strand:+ start:2240 stop:3079 length:840 start_codon:yes stop_codon:yes gene_type:complete